MSREVGRLRLILLSFLMLFVELVLIRWAGSNIVFLSYFSNFVLLGSFLGVGIGFLRAKKDRNLFPFAPAALAGLAGFVFVFQVRARIDPLEIPEYYRSPGATGLPIWVTLPVVFIAIAAVMALIGEGVAREFKRFIPLEAYRLDILGSILGVVAFSAMSWLSASPILWGIVAVGLFGYLLWPKLAWHQWAALAGLLVVLGLQSFGDATWSPYYRIEVKESQGIQRAWINGRPHQFLAPTEVLRQSYPQYWVPFLDRTSPPEDVLIVGAGTGAEAQAGLDAGAGHLDAVDIDPGIVALGYEGNPARPFADPRVETHVTDGRAFLENTDRTYDLIIFGLPDSLTLIAGNGGVRLESYLLTREALEVAREHLNPGGVFVVHEYFREPWVADRLGGALQEVFGAQPCRVQVDASGREVLFLVSPDPAAVPCSSGTLFTASADAAPPATDDRPFPYIRGASIPGFYVLSVLVVLIISFVAVRQTAGSLKDVRRYADLFFMGAGFLLIETKNVVQFALLFGTTWFVNALVFGGILVSVLAAIEVARRVRIRRPGLMYIALAASLAVAWLLPTAWLLSLPFAPRLVVAILVAFTPVFIANLVFAERFRDVGSSTVAFAANLLGAMVGGLLEYGALLVGYRGLSLLAGVFYAGAWLFGRRHLTGQERPEPEPPAREVVA